MRIDLTALARRATNPRRRSVTLRDIIPPAVLATDLYQAAYRPVVDLWSRAAERVIAEYERSLSALTTDAPIDLSAILEDAAGEFSRLFVLLRPALRDWTLRVERYHRDKWRGAVLAASKVDLQTMIGPEDVAEPLEQILNWNVELVKDVSQQARQRIGAAVFAGLTARTPVREVAAQIREAVGMSRRRATGIAADQLSKLASSLNDERQRQAGIKQVEWRSSHKLHPRPQHAARDGKLFYLDSHEAVDGSETVAQGDWVGQPPWCGCRTRGVLIFS